jgi:hypothetical protein
MWLSIPLFNNPVTLPGTVGSAIVVGGVLLYNKARDYERHQRSSLIIGTCHQPTVTDDVTAV